MNNPIIDEVRRIRDEHEQADIGAVIGDVNGFGIRHHIRQLDRHPAAGISFVDGGVAGFGDGDFHRIPVTIRIEHRTKIIQGHGLGKGI